MRVECRNPGQGAGGSDGGDGDAPLVSVCIPAFNNEKHVAAAVDSALRQTYRNIEVVCVDDGSTDSTGDLLAGYGDAITLIRTGNRGAQLARNLALARSRGQFVQFLDADNYLCDRSIEHKIAGLVAGRADVVFSNQVMLHDCGRVQHVHPRQNPANIDPFAYCLAHNVPGGTTAIDNNVALHRADLLRRIGGFRDGVVPCDDKDLALRLAAAGARFEYVDLELSVYRDHGGPRLSTRERNPGYPLTYFVDLVPVLLASPIYHLTPPRREALARTLVDLAKDKYRAGQVEIAKRGFACAGVLGNVARYPHRESRAYRAARSLLGYGRTEYLRAKRHQYWPSTSAEAADAPGAR